MGVTNLSLLTTSDKVFWHGFTDFYEPFFQGRKFAHIAEVGVFKGNSIRWLLDKFPEAEIHGADILPRQPEWPVDTRFVFTQMDQGHAYQVRSFFKLRPFELIIEDGSHNPAHQVLAVVEGIKALSHGGLYILEDVHTSHPANAGAGTGNALTVLLAIDHYQRLGRSVNSALAAEIARNSIVSPADVQFLAEALQRISLYRRTRLPDCCYRCNATDFNYSALRCTCGADIFSDSDSMSFVLEKA